MRTPVIIALRGDLGAGMSVLARAIARGAGVDAPMPSPTFNLLFRYETERGITVSHLDLYRLEDPAEVWELGWRELGAGNEIVLIEWPEHAELLLPPVRWDIRIEAGSTAETRIITATPVKQDGVEPHPLPEPQL